MDMEDPDSRDERPGAEPTLIGRVPAGLVFRWTGAGTAAALLVLLAAYGLYIVRGILILVLIALFIAISLDPVVRWLVGKGMRRTWAVTLVLLVLVALTAAFIWSVVPPMVGQGRNLIGDLPSYLRRLSGESKPVRSIIDRYNLTDRLNALVADLPGQIANGAVGFVHRFLGVLTSTLTVLVLTIYFMAGLPRLQHGVVALFPRHRHRAQQIVDVVVDKVGGYMIGNIIISLFAGVSSAVCLEVLRVPFAVPLAVTVALADLIPMVGASLGAVICVVAAVFTVGVWPRGVIVLVFFIAYQQVENYLIAPRVLRNTVDLSAVAVLLVALIGGTVLGLVGAIMAIPIAAAVKVVMSPKPALEPAQPPGPATPSARTAADADPPVEALGTDVH